MKTPVRKPGWSVIVGLGLVLAAFAKLHAAETPMPETNTNALPIDLPTALRLAGAQNLEVKLADEKLAEARAAHSSALAQFFPWIAPGIAYRRHDNLAQDTAGTISEVHKDSYAPGGAVVAQMDLGDAIYKTLAAKQVVRAAGHAAEVQRQESALAAATAYFGLAQAAAAVGVARESVAISSDYGTQLQRAVEAGIAFKGDQLRAQVQTERNRLALRQAEEQRRLAATRLAQILHLDPAVDLTPHSADPVPLSLLDTNLALGTLIQQSLAQRPEFKQHLALVASAQEAKKGAVYGPLIPTVSASVFAGGLGGGPRGSSGTFGEQEDYFVALSWRIGPGGLFDPGRKQSATARLKMAQIDSAMVHDAVSRQVVDSFARWQSLGDQLSTALRGLAAAQEGLRLARERKELAVGVVLENIQAEQDLTRARMDYLRAVAEFDQAQYALLRATGKL